MQPQVILITGASSGFGKITAQMLSEQGHIVYGTSRKPSGNMNNVKMLVAMSLIFFLSTKLSDRLYQNKDGLTY